MAVGPTREQHPEEPCETTIPEATVRPEEPRQTVILKVAVGPKLAECTGIGHRTCMVVDGRYFYERIVRFDYEPGYRYKIRIERYDRWPSQKEPRQDTSKYGYCIIEILEKVQEP